MPQKVVCDKCGEILYNGEILKAPRDIIKKFESFCPKCKKELSFDAEKVNIVPHDQ
jgi:hypothetical protein